MSEIGYYRYKTTVAAGSKGVQFFKNGILAGTKTIRSVDFCVGGRILKYLDTKGQYRFYPFTKHYEVNDKPKNLGSTSKFITSLLTDQTNSQNIGSRNTRSVDITAYVPEEDLEILSAIYASPRIYLYIGEGTSDTAKDWLEVEISSGDKTVRRRKAKAGEINFSLQLPEHYSVRMI